MERIKQLIKWIAVDGLLHFLVCYALMLALTPIIGIWGTLGITIGIATLKEAWDFFIDEDNNKEQVLHDLICDAAGIVMAMLTILLWYLCNI